MVHSRDFCASHERIDPMSDSGRGKPDEMTSRNEGAAASPESHLDADGVLHRIREAIGKVGSTVDQDALMGRVKEVVDQAEGRIDAGKLRQWVAELDQDKLRSLPEEAKHLGAGAVSLIGTQSEKLADRAPGVFDKLAGAAKGRLETLTGDEGPIGGGQLERFKGQLKDTIASVSEMAESRSNDAAETVKRKLDDER
jgi:uncharacterized protein YjbJ (UPF0337 family)